MMSFATCCRSVVRGCPLALVGLAFVLTGCGESDGLGTLHPVSGVVTADGKPLSRGSVRFQPDSAKGNTSKFEPAGEIGSDGKYTLVTQGKPGAPAGWYKVSVVSTDEPDSTKPLAVKAYVAKRFNAPETSNLSVEVVASPAPNAYDLKVSAQ